MRQLQMPLRVVDVPRQRQPEGEGLFDWSRSVRSSVQVCLLVGVDGVIIAVSEPAAGLLGARARPGVAIAECWRERSLQPGDDPPRGSLFARTVATGSPAHSVLSLEAPSGPTTVQVMVAPLQVSDGAPVAVLAFVWPMAGTGTDREP